MPRHQGTSDCKNSASSLDSTAHEKLMSSTLSYKSGQFSLENKLTQKSLHLARHKSDNLAKKQQQNQSAGDENQQDHFISVVDLKNQKTHDCIAKNSDALGNESSKSCQITPQVATRKSPKSGIRLTQTHLVLSKNQFQPKS